MRGKPPTVIAQSMSDVLDWWFSLPGWAWIAILLVVGALTGYGIEKIAMAAARAWAKRTRWHFDDAVVDALHPSVAALAFVIVVWAGLHYLPINFSTITVQIIDNASITIGVFAAALGAVRIVRVLLHARAATQDRWRPLAVTGSRVIALIVYVVAFLVVINHYGIEITPILTTLGIAGLAVALALQDTLANVFSGIWIQTQRSMQPGHYIRLEDQKLEGFVDDVGWRTTKVRTLPGNLVVIPNQAVAKSTITDFSSPEPKMGTSITILTGFEADPERVVPMMLEECMAAADEVSFILKEPAPAARLNKAVENGWEYWMSIWVPHYYNQWNAQGYVLNRIRKRFLAEGIRMPYPIREVYNLSPERMDLNEGITAATRPRDARVPGMLAAVAEGDRSLPGAGTIKPTK